MSVDFDIGFNRQEDWVRDLQLTDLDGVPVNLTGATVLWQARAIAGTGEVLATATTSIPEPLNGVLSVRWHGPDFDGFGIPTQVLRVAHDCKITFADGVVDVPFRGQLIINPKVTA